MTFSGKPSAGKARKRFIAGARCPSCSAEDKIYLIGEGLDAMRRCNQCDFEERLGDVVEESEESEESQGDVIKIFSPQKDGVQTIKLPEDR